MKKLILLLFIPFVYFNSFSQKNPNIAPELEPMQIKIPQPIKAWEYLPRAMEKLRNGNYKESLADFEMAILFLEVFYGELTYRKDKGMDISGIQAEFDQYGGIESLSKAYYLRGVANQKLTESLSSDDSIIL